MSNFHFTVRDEEGRRTSGTIDAKDREAAMKILAERNLFVTALAEAGAEKSGWLRHFSLGPRKVSGEELLNFTQVLATLLEAALPLRTIMDTVSIECANPTLRQIIIEIASGLSYGKSLSDLLRGYPAVFSKLYIAMVAIGESSGNLPKTLAALASYIETTEEIRRKVKAALYYPIVIVVFSAVILAGVLTFGIPFIQGVYTNVGAGLPWPTRVLLAASSFFSRHFVILFVSIGLLIFLLIKAAKNPTVLLWVDALKLKIPLFGDIFRKIAISRFAKALSTVSASGIPLLFGMELVADAAGNQRVERVVRSSIDGLRAGKPLVEPFRMSPIFTPVAVSMIAAGEESGTLDSMLDKLAIYYDAQLDTSLKALISLVEPVMMILVGLAVSIIIFGLGLPFLNMVRAFQAGT